MRLKLLAAGTPTATSPDGADPARPGRPRRTLSLPQPKCLCKKPKFARLKYAQFPEKPRTTKVRGGTRLPKADFQNQTQFPCAPAMAPSRFGIQPHRHAKLKIFKTKPNFHRITAPSSRPSSLRRAR